MSWFKRRKPPEQKQGRTPEEILAILDGHGLDTDVGSQVNTSRAMMQTTVWACTRIVSEAIAMSPVYLQERQDNRTWTDVPDHPSLELLAAPNDWQTQHELIAGLNIWAELRGNGYALKSRGNTGPVRQLIPLRADDVEVEQGDDYRLIYKYGGRRYSADQMLHYRNFGTDSYVGLSTISNARNAIGLALEMEKHGAAVFKHGASIGKVITAPTEMGDDAYERLEKRLRDKYSSANNAHKTMILEGGLSIEEVGMSNDDSQWLDSRKFTKSEIATLFGVPDFMLNSTEKSTTWGTGLEQLFQAFVRITLKPRMSRFTQMLNRELIDEKDRRKYRYNFDTDAITMGEFAKRMEGYGSAINWGVLNPDEAREKEGLNPRADGKGGDYLTPMNMNAGAGAGNES